MCGVTSRVPLRVRFRVKGLRLKVVTSGVINRVTMITTHIRGLITPLILPLNLQVEGGSRHKTPPVLEVAEFIQYRLKL